jgi:hypothetical protein
MKKTAILSLLCIAISTTLSGCNNPKAANKENFAKVLTEYVAKNSDGFSRSLKYCNINIGNMPTERIYGVSGNDDFSRKSESLKNAGILTIDSREEERPYQGRVTIRKYDLTEKGKQIAKAISGTDVFYIPYCQVAFKEVKLFTEPADAFGAKVSQVDYTYAIAKVDDWVNHPEILQAYPEAKEALDSVGKPLDGKKALVLTSEGWSTGEK